MRAALSLLNLDVLVGKNRSKIQKAQRFGAAHDGSFDVGISARHVIPRPLSPPILYPDIAAGKAADHKDYSGEIVLTI